MLLFISPVIIKKLILNIFMTNLSVVMNAQAQDSLTLKREERIPTKIMKIEEHDINHRNAEKILFFTQNEVINPNKGLLIFECNGCAGKSTLRISGKASTFKFSIEATGSGELKHQEWMKPGTYLWEFEDARNHPTKGKVTLKKGLATTLIFSEK